MTCSKGEGLRGCSVPSSDSQGSVVLCLRLRGRLPLRVLAVLAKTLILRVRNFFSIVFK
jgi:hypothetical protein